MTETNEPCDWPVLDCRFSDEIRALSARLAEVEAALALALEAMHEAHSECRDYADTHPFIEQLDAARDAAAACLSPTDAQEQGT